VLACLHPNYRRCRRTPYSHGRRLTGMAGDPRPTQARAAHWLTSYRACLRAPPGAASPLPFLAPPARHDASRSPSRWPDRSEHVAGPQLPSITTLCHALFATTGWGRRPAALPPITPAPPPRRSYTNQSNARIEPLRPRLAWMCGPAPAVALDARPRVDGLGPMHQRLEAAATFTVHHRFRVRRGGIVQVKQPSPLPRVPSRRALDDGGARFAACRGRRVRGAMSVMDEWTQPSQVRGLFRPIPQVKMLVTF
jgi:hypothetical protein